MINSKLYAGYYRQIEDAEELQDWQECSKVLDEFYKRMYEDFRLSTNLAERQMLLREMNKIIVCSQINDGKIEREEKEDNPYEVIMHSMKKMHKAFLEKNWGLALAYNDRAYSRGFELYSKAQDTCQKNLAQRLDFLQYYQDLILTEQLRETK